MQARRVPNRSIVCAQAEAVHRQRPRLQPTELPATDTEKLKELLVQRLQMLTLRLQQSTPLPANGAAAICGHCEYRGVCRNAAEVRSAGATA